MTQPNPRPYTKVTHKRVRQIRNCVLSIPSNRSRIPRSVLCGKSAQNQEGGGVHREERGRNRTQIGFEDRLLCSVASKGLL